MAYKHFYLDRTLEHNFNRELSKQQGKSLIFPLLFVLFYLFMVPANAQNCCDVDGNVDLCYLSGEDYCGSNIGNCFGYSLDGMFMIDALTAKLTSPDNFGVNGIVDCELELIELTDVSSVMAINDAGCDIIFLPNVFIEPGTNIMDLSQSFIPEEILQNVYDWSLQCSNNLVIATQGEANIWGYTTSNSNLNPNTPIPGTSLNSIFEGAFGSLDLFNQGGTFQGVFTGTPPSSEYEVLANDANNNPTVVLDLVSNDIIVGDIGIFCSGGAGVVSPGPGINNNNDILICNMFALACELAQEANKVTVTHELCPGETVILPDGIEVNSPGIYVDTLTALNGCDSIITTSLAYGIETSPIFPEPDTTICEGDTISVDGTLPINLPVPFYENTTDLVIDPIFVNVISEIPVTGFGSTILGPGMIQSVCLDIDHNWLDDLDILLVAPNGELLELSTDNGLNQDDYIGTCFTETAAAVIGSAGTGAPFTGEFLPEGDWSDLYGSQINGIWQLVIQDDANGFQGTLLNWSITFSPILELNYLWETSTGLSCDNCPVPDAFPVQTTTYFLTMTDSFGCSTLDSTTIEVIPLLPAPVVSCDSITLNSINISWEAVSGAADYQINIDQNGWILPNNDGNLSYFLDGLSPLDTVEIMVQALDDCGGQISTITCSTPDCDAPIPSLVSFSPTSCFGSNDGALNLSALGGSGSGYTFELNGAVNTTGIFNNLTAGSYDILVTDDANCGIYYAAEVTQPDSIQLTPVIEQEISCFGFDDGSLSVAINNGVAPFSFFWNGEPADSILTNVSADLYTIQVTDANGCSTSDEIIIEQPPVLALQSDAIQVDCFGNTTGSATVIPEGGTLPYIYQWDNAADNQTTAMAGFLAAGSYTVTVIDNNDCEVSTIVEVNQPEILSVTTDFSNPNCSEGEDGQIQLTVSGGIPDYNYSWSPVLANVGTFSNLTAGTYHVTISDFNNCLAEASIQLEDPAPVTIASQTTDVSCFEGNNGAISIEYTGVVGTPDFSWSNGIGAQNINNLTAGDYCLTITDDNNCQAIDCISIEEPLPLALSLSAQNISCDEEDDGSIDLTISGGVSPYSFDWSNGSSSEDVVDLTVGNYSVTITDMNNCQSFASAELIQNTASFSLELDPTDVDCFGNSSGSVSLTANGSFGNLNYQWTGPENYQSGSQNISNVAAGTYAVTAEDEFGCQVTATIAIEEPLPLSAVLDIQDVSCFGSADGLVSILPEGGTFPYLYSIDSGQNFVSSALFSNLNGGNYNLIVQDANGCDWPANFEISEPEEIVIDIQQFAEIILGETYEYNAQVNIPESQIDTLFWTPTDSLSCMDCLGTFANPEYTTSYTIHLTTIDGCETQAFTTLLVDRRISVFVPNVFSPNGDGVNDILTVFAAETNIKRVKSFQVFDRWGSSVFYVEDFLPNNPEVGWDGRFRGKHLNPAVFVWIAEIELQDGQIELFQGDVTIVR